MGELIDFKNSLGGLPSRYRYEGWLRYPEGQYEAVLETWVTFRLMSSNRLALIFNIVDPGKHFGKHVPAFFGVKRHRGHTREKGGFIASPRGDLMDLFYRLNPTSPKVRLDRVPLSKLNDIYRITVQDVVKNRKQKKHPHQLVYSQVTDVKLQ
ncbi:hypothetical protein [Marinicella meishanensis]|uniref:hypothetical protein n=1 Tax=Marinicella meishanensis TaxID=2873263 RepID=UPI001CC00F1F|nr:hypothetical protein [Marinicella sp. NBU2979]